MLTIFGILYIIASLILAIMGFIGKDYVLAISNLLGLIVGYSFILLASHTQAIEQIYGEQQTLDSRSSGNNNEINNLKSKIDILEKKIEKLQNNSSFQKNENIKDESKSTTSDSGYVKVKDLIKKERSSKK